MIGALFLVSLLQGTIAPEASTLRWTECGNAPVAAARCATLTVPEDHDEPGSRRIPLSVVVLPALEQPAAADPMLILFGGPGDAGSTRLRAVAQMHRAVNAHRDLIILDQRGTGASSPLWCTYGDEENPQSYVDGFFPLAALQECRRRLLHSADLARYRTVDFARDIEALRAALGVERLNLHGTSYGTRVALHYMTQYPERVRSATLVGVAPPQLIMPAPFAADAERALNLVLSDCHSDRACRAAFPLLRAELDSVLRRLERAAAPAAVKDTATGRVENITLSRAIFGESVRAMLYTPLGARRLPIAIHEAFTGNYSAIATVAFNRHRGFARDGSLGLYLAVTCTEDIPRLDTAAAAALARGTLLGDARLRGHVAACDGWPRRSTSDEWPPLRDIAVPVFMIVGSYDPVTPPDWARRIAPALPPFGHPLSP